MTLQRFKLTIEYDGTSFAGWQRQSNAPTIQQTIEESLQKFVLYSDLSLTVAGRTDAGVHALGQVAHVDIPDRFQENTVRRALNFYLTEQPITVLKVEKVSPDFHARFSANSRSYIYKIINRPNKLALERYRTWHVSFPLNISVMQEAAAHLLGRHDFSAFRTVHCQAKNPIRTLNTIQIEKEDNLITFTLEAPSFLHHQVRNIVGTLVDVGRGKTPPTQMGAILESKDRAKAGPTAPAHGLYFKAVEY